MVVKTLPQGIHLRIKRQQPRRATRRATTARALYPADVLAWVQATQPKAWETLTKNHGAQAGEMLLARLRDQLDQRGTLDAPLILWVGFVEGVGADVDLNRSRYRALAAQLFGGVGHIGRDGLFQFGQGVQEMPRSSCTVRSSTTEKVPRIMRASAIRRSRTVAIPIPARRSVKRRPTPHTSPAPMRANRASSSVTLIRPKSHPPVSARQTFLGAMVGELGECLGGAETDTDRNAHPLLITTASPLRGQSRLIPCGCSHRLRAVVGGPPRAEAVVLARHSAWPAASRAARRRISQ